MAAPVSSSPSIHPAESSAAAVQPTPGGVGSTPTQMSSAAPASPPAPGFFERQAKALVSFFTSIYMAFARLLGCDRSVNTPEIRKLENALKRLTQDSVRPAQILADFHRYFSDDDKIYVYRAIAAAQPNPPQGIFSWLRGGPGPEQQGYQMAHYNPQLLLPDLRAKIQELLDNARAEAEC